MNSDIVHMDACESGISIFNKDKMTDVDAEMKGVSYISSIYCLKSAEVNNRQLRTVWWHFHALPVVCRLQRSTTNVQV